VKPALGTLGRLSLVDLKLGPSREFLDEVKQLEKFERLLKIPTTEPKAHSGRASKRARRSNSQLK
jgi:hypothetical protein